MGGTVSIPAPFLFLKKMKILPIFVIWTIVKALAGRLANGRVAKLADAYASGAYGEIHGGSSPLAPTFYKTYTLCVTHQIFSSFLLK